MSRLKDRKVARAASIGGGVTSRGKRSTGWYLILLAVAVGGSILIYQARAYRVNPASSDHWHTALGIYVCDAFVSDLQQPSTLLGLHTHTDGLIHVEPLSDADPTKSIGTRANLGRFFQGHPDVKVSKTMLQVPGQPPKKNGDMCGDKPGKVKVSIWDKRTSKKARAYTGDPKLIHMKDGQLLTIGFVPDGTELPRPPSEPRLSDPNAAENLGGAGAGQPPGGVPGAPTPGGVPGAPAPGGVPGAPAPGGVPGASTPDVSVGIQDPAEAPQDSSPAPAGP